MSGKSNFVDYEPLRNDRGAKTSNEDDSDFRKARRQEAENEFPIPRKSVQNQMNLPSRAHRQPASIKI